MTIEKYRVARRFSIRRPTFTVHCDPDGKVHLLTFGGKIKQVLYFPPGSLTETWVLHDTGHVLAEIVNDVYSSLEVEEIQGGSS